MTPAQVTSSNDYVKVINPEGQSSVVVVCEHASSYIPPIYRDLGLTGDALQSHAAVSYTHLTLPTTPYV